MTDGSNGLPPELDEAAAAAKENYDLHMALSKEVMQVWIKYQQATTMDPTRFTRVTAQTLTYMAAILAVDVHQSEEHFLTVARECHKSAYGRASKFG